MKRTDITELFPDATKEQIDKLMGINGADINAAKSELESLQQQIEGLKNSPSVDKLKEAQDEINKLSAELNGMKTAETIRLTREKVATEKNIPASLLTGETEEACAKQADEILAFAQKPKYPVVRDGGETNHTSKPSTRDQFADWAKENIQ